MEKLIELLNEYRTEKGERNLNEFEVSQTLDSLNYLRSFIDWLVENDKVDFKKLHSEYWYYKLVIMCDFNTDLRYDVLLMILSIQDNPIEYLCSILR